MRCVLAFDRVENGAHFGRERRNRAKGFRWNSAWIFLMILRNGRLIEIVQKVLELVWRLDHPRQDPA